MNDPIETSIAYRPAFRRNSAPLVFCPEIDKIELPINAEGRKRNSMQPIFVNTNDRIQGGIESAAWSVAYYFFGL